MQIRTLAALAGLALCAAGANAQFITGITKPVFSTNQPNAYFVDAADIDAFFLFWEDGSIFADINLDGGIDGADVEAFFAIWEGGGG
ncbi:MAG: hypothetical protein KF859_07105 [Phycisphaeraceae bacterium]|nr:hypothetical protein [Phycisphaeraceae bacterium]